MTHEAREDVLKTLDNAITAVLCYSKNSSEAGDDDTAQGLLDVAQSLQIVGKIVSEGKTQ